MTFGPDHPLRPSIDHLIQNSEAYQRFNPTLNDRNQGLLGTKDPERTYRAQVTFEWINVNDLRRIRLVSVEAAHWLDKHYSHELTPAQQLCADNDK